MLVLGASSGLGRSLGAAFAARGHRVAFAARRGASVDEAAAEAGWGSIGIECDVSDPLACESAVETAVDAFGGLDTLLYCAGVNRAGPLIEVDADGWLEALATNVIGAALVTRAAVPHLGATNGTAVYLSSVSASETSPWPGLGVYATSKAALDKLIEAWTVEHPEVAFTRIAMGNSAGGPGQQSTQMADSWDPDVFMRYYGLWLERGLSNGGLIDVDDLVSAVDTVINSDAHVPRLVLQPRQPRLTSD